MLVYKTVLRSVRTHAVFIHKIDLVFHQKMKLRFIYVEFLFITAIQHVLLHSKEVRRDYYINK
jgi:hypothetical protein